MSSLHLFGAAKRRSGNCTGKAAELRHSLLFTAGGGAEGEKKSSLVSCLNHTFNMTGRRKKKKKEQKSTPCYADTHERSLARTGRPADTHMRGEPRTKTTLKRYSATRCFFFFFFRQSPDYNTNGGRTCARVGKVSGPLTRLLSINPSMKNKDLTSNHLVRKKKRKKMEK